MALSVWVVGLPIWISAAVPRRLADDQLFRASGLERYGVIVPTLLRPRFRRAAAGFVWRMGDHALATDQRRKGAIARNRHSADEDRMNRIDNSQRIAAKIAGITGL